MGNRADEIRRQIAKRKRTNQMSSKRSYNNGSYFLPSDEERYGAERYSSFEGGPPPEGFHPLFKKEAFIMKVLGAGIMVLLTAIMFKSPSPVFDDAKTVVNRTMESEFQFASISSWYEEQFGKPLALLPGSTKDEGSQTVVETDEYARPVSGKVVENFKTNGQGIMLQTEFGEDVAAMKGGLIIFAGKKDKLGNTVVIQHKDKSESWYGHLESIDVNQYEYVDKGTAVGKVSTSSESNVSGEFYFAIKMGDEFVDPIQVISFD
ncbi:M23 family metallopeptidase [Rossellomorea aquimaris]|uniref:M23 family metallopeptidase n=1 Tax=Rossellomorea aquimaris TaxID=189382 RepID=UPI001CD46BC3|nr:M23 family metallopeptidase [Rossellomorea aquimaris]MCA1056310.1 M23 family metallopeptidase [Rossellomorea aquimaris]